MDPLYDSTCPPGEPAAGAPVDPSQELEFEHFLVAVRPKVRRVFARYRIPGQDAEDLLQEALLAAVGKWPTIQSKEAWLVVTLCHKCSVYWRDRRRSRIEEVDDAQLEQLAPPQRAGQERVDLQRDLRRLLSTLERRHRALIVLRYGVGFSPLEVAERLGYHEGSIRKLACRSMEKMQRAVRAPLPRRR
jgi:RNA polymerase sigma factor (sigma-70 family)